MELMIYYDLEHINYLRENDINKICGFNLFCCQINFYRNAKYYFNCYYYRK